MTPGSSAASVSIVREAHLEALINRLVRAAGGICIKGTGQAGTPDRVVLTPDGTAHLVELKTATGQLSLVQQEWHRRAADRGWPVTTLYGPEEIRVWVERNVG